MFLVLASLQCWELQANIIKKSNCLLKEDVESGSNPYLELLNYGVALMLSADISFSRKKLTKGKRERCKRNWGQRDERPARGKCGCSVGVQCGVPASRGSGVDGRHSYHRDSSEFKSHLTGTITPGKPSRVGTGRPRQPHKLLQPPAERTWQCINLLQSHIQPTQSCFL